MKPDPDSRNYIQWLRLLLALIVISFVYLYRLDRPLLWGDEADTGIEARNILRCGYPMAYDGRNVSVYESGSQLNRNLLCKKIPWVQYYLAAASLAVFGNNTAGLRCLFAIAGVIAFVVALVLSAVTIVVSMILHSLIAIVIALIAVIVIGVFVMKNMKKKPGASAPAA